MLMALNNQNNYVYAENAKKNKNYFCPECRQSLILKKGNYMIMHFAHHKQTSCDAASEGETLTHLEGKRQLMRFFAPSFPDLKLEVYLKAIRQRPDLMLNQKMVIEYQCSPIKTKRLDERLNGYQNLNIYSNWILGPQYYQQKLSHKLCQQFMCYSTQLGFYMQFWLINLKSLVIRYQIRSINGQFKYLEKRFKDWLSYHQFITTDHVKNQFELSDMSKEILQLKHKVIFRDKKTLLTQSFCYRSKRNLLGCPLICHYPTVDYPWLPNRIIELKVLIILLLEKYQTLSIKKFNEHLLSYFPVNVVFCMLNISLAEKIIINFIKLLKKNSHVSIQNGQIKLIKPFEWYDDEYKKILKIKSCSFR